MIIQNFNELISAVKTKEESERRKIILELLETGINSVLPCNIIPTNVKLKNKKLIIQNFQFDLSKITNIYVVGAGKASGAMAEEIEKILQPFITSGLVNVPYSTKREYNTQIIQLNEASHPIPSESGVIGAKKIIQILNQTKATDLVIVLLSGGGSALLPLPADEIDLKYLQQLNNQLIKSGATIQEINTVRKHCSQIKGGQLIKFAYPAEVITLILSDVIGNPLDSIASGPTVPDPTTYKQAIKILKHYHLWEKVNESIKRHLQNGIKGIIPETPKPNDKIFRKTYTFIIGDIKSACNSIKKTADHRGFFSKIYSYNLVGEARLIGKEFLKYAKNLRFKDSLVSEKPIILIAGGETTVTVKGKGVGGRCQEMGLAIISEFQNLENYVFAALGTDGIDGFTNAAGVIIDKYSTYLMNQKSLNPQRFLDNNDSYNFFKNLGDSLIFTGPTGTNVNDLMLIGIF